jgi:serine/threonine protein kinase
VYVAGATPLANTFLRSGVEPVYTPIPAAYKRTDKPLIDVGAERSGDVLDGLLPPERALYVRTEVRGSLAEARAKGLIHRNIRPSDIMLWDSGGRFETVEVLDFVRVKDTAEGKAELTQLDVLVGTPLHLAPEVIRAPQQAGLGSDLHALGAVGYFLLAGRNVFEGELETLALQCLEKNPAHRTGEAPTS